MKLYVPKITIDQLTTQEISLYKNLSSNSYGTVLAAQVIDKLKNTLKYMKAFIIRTGIIVA